MSSFVPRAAFPVLDSLPRSYYLGHHAAGLSKMRAMLSQIDLVVECRDARIPLTSRNPMFEDALANQPRLIVYTKKDLIENRFTAAEAASTRPNETAKKFALLRRLFVPSSVQFYHEKNVNDVRRVLNHLRTQHDRRGGLTGSHLMVVGMPNVGKSSLLNALRREGVGKGKAAHTGAQPGVTRKIGTSVKILEDRDGTGVYLLDTPGVFIPYVPDAEAMLKLALCGSVKDNIIAPFTLADYLLFHINRHDPSVYMQYHHPTNNITELLEAIAGKTGRLQKGGTADLESTALWMVQRWRTGHLGRFMLDDVNPESIERFKSATGSGQVSLTQARRMEKELIIARAQAKKNMNSGFGAFR